jgi:hypothetical protein
MFNKIIKLFLFLSLFINFSSFCRQKPDEDSKLMMKYNNWLKTIQLDDYFQVGEVKPGPETNNNGTNSKVLVLKPANERVNLINLSRDWANIRDGLKNRGADIYLLMLEKLAAYSGLPLSNVSIELETKNPNIFSFKISFDGKIILEEHNTNGKGGNATGYNFDSALGSLIYGDFTVKTGITDLRKYDGKLEALFSKFKSKGGPITFKWETHSNDMLTFWVFNIYGYVTGGNYHELAYFKINLSDMDKNEVKIHYDMQVLYAGGIILPPASSTEYSDAANDFPRQLSDFNRLFVNQIEGLFP